MSIFGSETRVTIPLPHDAPHTVTLQKLTRAQFMGALELTGEARVRHLVKHGLVGWSYTRAVDDQAIDDLGVDETEFISDEVVYLARPSLRPKPETETPQDPEVAAKEQTKN